MPTKIYALCGGGDWADASVTHLVVPSEVDVDKVYKEYQAWMRDVWFGHKKGEKWWNFDAWLIEKYGARRATDGDIKIFWED